MLDRRGITDSSLEGEQSPKPKWMGAMAGLALLDRPLTNRALAHVYHKKIR